jgi:hypothetical protein
LLGKNSFTGRDAGDVEAWSPEGEIK